MHVHKCQHHPSSVITSHRPHQPHRRPHWNSPGTTVYSTVQYSIVQYSATHSTLQAWLQVSHLNASVVGGRWSVVGGRRSAIVAQGTVQRAVVPHSEPLGVTRSHSESLGATRSHSESLGVTRSHSESLGVTRSHSEPLRVTRSHLEPLGVTRSESSVSRAQVRW